MIISYNTSISQLPLPPFFQLPSPPFSPRSTSHPFPHQKIRNLRDDRQTEQTRYHRQGKSPNIKAVQGIPNRKEKVPSTRKRDRDTPAPMLGVTKTTKLTVMKYMQKTWSRLM